MKWAFKYALLAVMIVGRDQQQLSEQTAMEEDLSSSFTGIVGDGSVDLRGCSVRRAHTGRWKASLFIIGITSFQFYSLQIQLSLSVAVVFGRYVLPSSSSQEWRQLKG